MKFTLTHLTGSRAGSVQELTGHVLTIGRDPSNALAFDPVVDADVSGFHANLTVQGAQVLLSDLGSSNGTLVNGQRIQGSVPLISGCTIQFGEKGPIVSVQFAPLAAAASGAEGGPAGGAGPGGASAGAGAAGAAAGAPGAAGTPGGAGPGAGASAGAGGAAPAAPTQAQGGAAPQAPQAPGSPDAPAAPPPPPKPPSALAGRLKGCGLKVVGTVILTLVLGAVCYVFRGQIQKVVPSGAQRYLRKIPGVSLIFSKAKSPTQALPPAARDAKRMLPKGSKSKPEKTSEDKTGD